MKKLLSISLMFVSAVAVSQNYARHEQELKDIRTKVGVNIVSTLTFPEKIQAVHALHELVMNSDLSDEFSPEALIRDVVIQKPVSTNGDSAEIQELGKLRGHLFIFTTGGETVNVLRARLKQEGETLRTISQIESAVKRSYPNIQIERETDVLTHVVTTNDSHLALLQSLNNALTSRSLDQAVRGLDGFFLNDSADHLAGFEMQRTTQSDKNYLYIRIGRPWTYSQDLMVDPSLMTEAMSILFDMNFKHIDSQLLEKEESPEAIKNLYSRLNAHVVEQLQAQGITGFILSSNWRSAENLVQNHELVVGPKVEDIDAVLAYFVNP